MIKTIDEIKYIANLGPFKPNYKSLQTKDTPKWFMKFKFGIFIHWGLYSIPAFNNEWYSKNMYVKDSYEYHYHLKTYGKHKDFGYKDFIPMFKADKFNPDVWAAAIKDSGAKYTLMVSEHHDGFQMYQSQISKWNSFNMGPKIDILKSIKESLEKKKILFGVSNHRAEHWFFMSPGLDFESDINNDLRIGDFYWPAAPEKDHYDFSSKPAPSQDFLDDWLKRNVEIIDKYMPSIYYLDWWVQHESFKPYLKLLLAYYYNMAAIKKKEVIFAYKHDALIFGSGILEIERGKFASIKHFPWQTETSIANNSWCYTNNLDYKTTYEVITTLIDVVSKNGNLLLNIGPKGNGEIPLYEINLLKEVGSWLKINGEAIYDSKPYHIFGEGNTEEKEGFFKENKINYKTDDFRFTINNGSIYIFALNPQSEKYIIKSLKKGSPKNHDGLFSNITNVKLLGNNKIKSFAQDEDGLKIKIDKQTTDLPLVFKVEVE